MMPRLVSPVWLSKKLPHPLGKKRERSKIYILRKTYSNSQTVPPRLTRTLIAPVAVSSLIIFLQSGSNLMCSGKSGKSRACLFALISLTRAWASRSSSSLFLDLGCRLGLTRHAGLLESLMIIAPSLIYVNLSAAV